MSGASREAFDLASGICVHSDVGLFGRKGKTMEMFIGFCLGVVVSSFIVFALWISVVLADRKINKSFEPNAANEPRSDSK